MRFLCLFLLALSPLFAQPNAGSTLLAFGEDFSYLPVEISGPFPYLLRDYQYSWEVTKNPDKSKSFYFAAFSCHYDDSPPCVQLSISAAELLAPVHAALQAYYSRSPSVYHHPPEYGPFAELVYAPRAKLTQALTPAVDPQMVFLDGLSSNIVKFDLATLAPTSVVSLPPQPEIFGIRPSASGPENEVWAAPAGTVSGISISDLGAQSVLATIPIPSLAIGTYVPVGIVFTNSGLTALYAVSYYAPDASGNNGALLVFDVVNRKLTSTLPLKWGPSALLMAPDGSTAYLLNASSGMITYYDVLSGTADLTASTYTPGKPGGYGGGQAFIHPDGTRLFWNLGVQLAVFDLTTRKVTNLFNSGLPTTSAASMQMSPDGSTIWFANALGNIAILDTRYGNVMATYQAQPGTQAFPGPAN